MLSGKMSDRMPNRLWEYMSDRMSVGGDHSKKIICGETYGKSTCWMEIHEIMGSVRMVQYLKYHWKGWTSTTTNYLGMNSKVPTGVSCQMKTWLTPSMMTSRMNHTQNSLFQFFGHRANHSSLAMCGHVPMREPSSGISSLWNHTTTIRTMWGWWWPLFAMIRGMNVQESLFKGAHTRASVLI